MLLVIALPDLAKRIADLELIEGVHSYVVSVADAKELRHKVHGHQPEVLVLDYRMGGLSWRAMDQISLIVERTASKPYVIAVVPWVNRVVEIEAAKNQAYNVVVLNEKKAQAFARDLSSAVAVARKARAARGVKADPRARDRMLH